MSLNFFLLFIVFLTLGFTPEKISEELSFISDWFELAHPFLDDSDKIRAAIKNTPLTERRVRAMEAWIESYDMPSWEEVAQTVEDIFTDHVDIPYHLRKKYLPEVKPMKKEELRKFMIEEDTYYSFCYGN